jgi:hypothetical protein
VATIAFMSDWSQEAEGSIQPGERLTIKYAPDRAQVRHVCHHGGWMVTAFVRFPPAAEVNTHRVVETSGQSEPGGIPRFPRKAITTTSSYELTVPEDATEVEIWFRNIAVCGEQAWWDSRYGQNFRFQVHQ